MSDVQYSLKVSERGHLTLHDKDGAAVPMQEIEKGSYKVHIAGPAELGLHREAPKQEPDHKPAPKDKLTGPPAPAPAFPSTGGK